MLVHGQWPFSVQPTLNDFAGVSPLSFLPFDKGLSFQREGAVCSRVCLCVPWGCSFGMDHGPGVVWSRVCRLFCRRCLFPQTDVNVWSA